MQSDFGRIIDALPGLVWTALPDGQADFLNQRWCEYTGFSTAQAIKEGWHAAVHPDDLPHMLDYWLPRVAAGQDGEVEARLKQFDGEYRWFSFRFTPVKDAAGQIIKWCGLNTDIEDRMRAEEVKRADEALRAREREQKRMIDSTPALIWTSDTKGRVEWINQTYVDYVGMPLDQMPRQGWEITHPDDLDRLIAMWRTVIASGKTGEVEARLRRYDGAYRWFLFRASPMRNERGTIVKWYGVATDIEERKQAEAALKASERSLQLVIEAAPAQVWSTTPDGQVVSINRRYLDYVGFPLEQALGWGWLTAIHPDDRDALTDVWRGILARGVEGEAETRLRRYDGTYRWFLMRASPLRDENGNIVRWYGVSTDIEDRMRAENELRHSEAFLAQGEAVSETGSFFWRLETNEIRWSEQLRRLYEFEPGERITLKRIATHLHPDDVRMSDAWVDLARAGQDSEYEHRLLMPNGRIKYLHFVGRAIRDRDGRLEYIGIVQDVTARRIAEQTLSKVRSELAHVSRVSSLGALTASIAHEVNQPLAGIVMNASTCLRMLAADPPNVDGARETARRTIRDGNRASEVITRLRALFSKETASFESIDLNEAAREVVALSLNELQRSRVILRQELDDLLPPVAGDRVQLQQVILNLMLNASDAMSGVSDRLRFLLIKTELDEDNQVRLSVKDSGVGIDPQNFGKLFEAFFTTKPGGMGIGLSVSRSIIERHHGRLWAQADDGHHGATFLFSIPRASEEGIGASLYARDAGAASSHTQ